MKQLELKEQLILFAEWLEYNGKYLLPHEQVQEYLKQMKDEEKKNA